MASKTTQPILTTTTEELFLPSRIVYRVTDRAKVLATFRRLRCMTLEPSGRWTWNYEFEAKKMGFPQSYEEIPHERQPVVLASCYWVNADRLHVYLRSTLRLTKFLVFFDRHVSRNDAQGEFFDEYNLLTTQDPQQPIPTPEDYFRDESKIAFVDVDSMESAEVADLTRRERDATLQPLDRHRLTAFYEDGPDHMTTAMQLRELLAMEQYRSAEPIRPFEVMRGFLDGSRPVPGTPSDNEDAQPGPGQPGETSETNLTMQPGLVTPEDPAFSFLKWDPLLDREVFELGAASSPRGRYVVSFSCCANPACDCRVLDLWLWSLADPGPLERTRHLALDTEVRQVKCAPPKAALDRRLASELRDRMTPADWALARHIYCSDKADHSEPANAQDLDAVFPPEVLADPGLLIRYQAVFPHARQLRFEADGKSWIVFEEYCSNPECGCQELFLDVAPLPEESSADTKVVAGDAEAVELAVDHATGRVSVKKASPPGWPPALELFAALKAAHPKCKAHWQRRQRVLRQLHQQARQFAWRQSYPQPVRAPKKVGRNQPCPCGSGKKFKQCCGR